MHQDALRALGFAESPLAHPDERLLGLGIRRWTHRTDQQGVDATFYLERRGFGVLVDRLATDARLSEHDGVVRLLEQRKRLHEEVRQETHPLAELVASLCDRVESRLGKSARRSLWKGVPYVFTFYVDEDYNTRDVVERTPSSNPLVNLTRLPPCLSNRDTATLQGILALSEPSRIGIGDTEIRPLTESEPGRTRELVGRVSGLEVKDMPPDIDINDAVYCGATWASLVVVGLDGEPGSTIHTYELLEVRTQIAWLAAHLVRRWCEKGYAQQEAISSTEVDEIRWQVIPLLREARRLSDAGMSTRHAGVFRGLKQTSGLDQEIEAAEDTLQWSVEAAERAERRQGRRYKLAVELLLGVIAVLQLATLVSDVPLVSLPRWAAFVILVAFASALALVIVRNRER